MEELEDGDPRRIGPYELLGKLGSGGMGRVFLGRSAAGALAAVKVVHPDLARDSEFRRRFQREVAATVAVSGPHVARIVHADTEAEQPWLATEYVAGPSLQARVEQHGPLPPHQVAELGVRLAGALAAIHAAGLVHRDVKPSNILLAANGPKLIDFGIARDTADSRLTRTGVAVGTPLFMAPEQIQGDSEAGSAADVFALAGVLVHAATGGYPFGEGTAVQLLYRIVHDQPRLDGVPDELRSVLAACLDKEPARRPSAREVAAALGTADREAVPPGFTALDVALDAALDAVNMSFGTAQPSRDEVATERLNRDEVATVQRNRHQAATGHFNRGSAPTESAGPSGVAGHMSREPGGVPQGELLPVVIAGRRPAPGKRHQNAYIFTGAGVLTAIIAIIIGLSVSGMSGVTGGSGHASANSGNTGPAGTATSTAADGIVPTGPSSGGPGTGGTASPQAGKTGAPSAGTAPGTTPPGARSTRSASAPSTSPHSSSAGAPSAGGTSSAPGTKTSSPSAPAKTAGPPACDTKSCSAFSHTDGVVRSVQADKCFIVDTRGSNLQLPPLGSCTGAAAQWRIWRDGDKADVMFESLYYPGYCFGFNNPSLEPCSDNYIYMGWYTPSAVGQHWALKYYDGQGYCDTVDSSMYPGSEPCKSPAPDSQLWDFQ